MYLPIFFCHNQNFKSIGRFTFRSQFQIFSVVLEAPEPQFLRIWKFLRNSSKVIWTAKIEIVFWCFFFSRWNSSENWGNLKLLYGSDSLTNHMSLRNTLKMLPKSAKKKLSIGNWNGEVYYVQEVYVLIPFLPEKV